MAMKTVLLGCLLFMVSHTAAAQSASAPAQAAPATPQSAQTPQQQAQVAEPAKLVLKEGTDVKLKFAQDLSSKTAAEDDPVNLVLDEDLKVGDVVVAKAGAKAQERSLMQRRPA